MCGLGNVKHVRSEESFPIHLSRGGISHITPNRCWERVSNRLLQCYSQILIIQLLLEAPEHLKLVIQLYHSDPISVINQLLLTFQISLRILAPNSRSFCLRSCHYAEWPHYYLMHQCNAVRFLTFLMPVIFTSSLFHLPVLHVHTLTSPFLRSTPPLKV